MHRFQFQFVYIVLGILLFSGVALGVPKPHVVNFGKWTHDQVVCWRRRKQMC